MTSRDLILANYIKEYKDTPFVWGEHDCILFAAKAYKALTGVDYYTKYLPYSSEDEAMKILKENGGVMGIISKNLGPGLRNIKKAQRGCPVVLKNKYKMCGIISGDGVSIIAPGDKGLVYRPLSEGIAFWRI